eukprot:CAMPEP_0202688058 /NCGR_PEP_ID=MMETSP1385-20130828/3592_1 /ASSEMBLY_ACC=CAM_ASM_000861 /TAXON_ID=933848 /ORGANISM="Elphidium margaritaceum" /LENGTH=190 /DNA_ID=CAMNT_0049342939 /DNA_START=50 /DNA_END=619 /DNA_ORIENTATION=+
MLVSILAAIVFAYEYGVAGQTRYVVDTIDLLETNYAFPLDMCLQPSVANALASTVDVFTTYECNADGTEVTKYLWDGATIADLSEEQRACTDKATATTTVFTAAGASTPCDAGYFICNGADNYGSANVNVYFGENTDNCATAGLLTLPLVVATGADVCTCDATADTSAAITCTADSLQSTNYTGTACAGT